MPQDEKIVPKKALLQKYRDFLEQYKVIYVQAHTGWGKTSVIANGFAKTQMGCDIINGGQEDFSEALRNLSKPLCIVDDMHRLKTTVLQNELVQGIIHSPPEQRFILLSRIPIPGYLRPFELTGQLLQRNSDDLKLTAAEIGDLLLRMNISFNSDTPLLMLEAVGGYPLRIKMLALHMARGESLNQQLYEVIKQELFSWYDIHLMETWSDNVKNALLYLAPFERFDTGLVLMLVGSLDIKKTMGEIMDTSGFLQYDTVKREYFFLDIFHEYLVSRQQLLWSEEKRNRNDENAGLYFELTGDVMQALKCYSRAGFSEKVAELLIQDTRDSIGFIQYHNTREYYLSLSREQILSSPELITAMSMISSLWCRREESNEWLKCLKDYAGQKNLSEKKRINAEEWLFHLRLSLPHLTQHDFSKTLEEARKQCQKRHLVIPQIDVTGGQPGILNGRRDLIELTRMDPAYFRRLEKTLNVVMGAGGKGLVEIIQGEILFEKWKDANSTEALMLLTAGIRKAEVTDNLFLRFAGAATMAKIFLAQGKSAMAMDYLKSFNRHIPEHPKLLKKNLQAILTQMAMCTGAAGEVEEWMEEEAPDEQQPLYIAYGHCYMVKARGYLRQGRNANALTLLTDMRNYCIEYHRIRGIIETELLLAITFYRLGEEEKWQRCFKNAVEKAAKYDDIRVISAEGAAVFPLAEQMLEKCDIGTEQYRKRLMETIREQAVYYPGYLKSTRGTGETLRENERKILRLVAQGLNNEEIGKLLGLSLNTIKTYLKNMYHKLGVKNRVECSKKAAELFGNWEN
ncbi:MAG: LuxR C-terminal-related transcriptional regulator [Lachnospiraceae bacterium]|nr:LuxR C-terminal-related transcriptional regulator [Lachnospiraceae bacterium]